MAAERFRVGLIGFGLGGASFHAPLIQATEGLELTHVVTANPDRQAQARAAIPGVTVLPSMSTGATDMSQLRARGIQCYGIGPAVNEASRVRESGSPQELNRVLSVGLVPGRTSTTPVGSSVTSAP